MGPLEAFSGDPLQIQCVSNSFVANFITIVEGSTEVSERLTTVFVDSNIRVFSLDTINEDNGRVLNCAVNDNLSPPVIVSILCKCFLSMPSKLVGRFSIYNENTKQAPMHSCTYIVNTFL